MTQYYGDDLWNPDPSVLDHYKAWNDQDVALMRGYFKDQTLVEKLDTYAQVMDASFDKNQMNITFAKLAAFQYLCSVLVSLNTNPQHSVHEACVEEALGYLKEGRQTPLELRHEAGIADPYQPGIYQRTGLDWINFCKAGFRFLPIITTGGNSSIRNLNQSYALGCPVGELPLLRSGFDGVIAEESSQEGAAGHDAQHACLNPLNNDQATLHQDRMTFYSLYKQFNHIVLSIENQRDRNLCDFFLFEFGHENYFMFSSFMNPRNFTMPETFDADCDAVVTRKIEDFNDQFDRKGNLPTFEERIIQAHLPKDRQLPYSRDGHSGSGPGPYYPATYNQLFDLQATMKVYGIEYPVWKDGHINVEGALALYREMAETFKRVVGPKFKGN